MTKQTLGESSMFYREWCSKVQNRKGLMVPVTAIPNLLKLSDTGYASVYMFKEADALEIRASGHSAGFDKYEVAADALVIDIDNGDLGLQVVMNALHSRRLAYEIWSSGGKGYHVVIPHDLVTSTHLPHSHKKAIEEMGLVVDTSLYQHGRLLSLPGRVHPKTKKKKRLLQIVDGKRLDLKIVVKPEPVFNFDEHLGLSELTKGLKRVIDMIEAPPSPGNRHTKLWGAAKDLADSGLSFDTVVDIMEGVNGTWDDKKDPSEIRLAVEQAFRTTTGR